MFLSSLPSSYDQLKHTLKYCKESITLEEVISAARSKQREINVSNKSDKGSATSIYTSDRGRSNRRESGDSRGGIGVADLGVNQNKERSCVGTSRRKNM